MSWRRDDTGYDLFFNRDERRSRLPAEAPGPRRAGSTRVLAPRDGEAGGSWIAVNEHGLSVALLNGYHGSDSEPGHWTSRGRLVMDLAGCADVAALDARLEATDLAPFRTFHLVGLDRSEGLLASWVDGSLERRDEGGFAPPLVSSSYRFEQVRESRRKLFADRSDVDAILDYHRSHSPERGPSSPCMHRDDARTVSFTWVRVDPAEITMRYSPDSPCRAWPPRATVSIRSANAGVRAPEESPDRSSTSR